MARKSTTAKKEVAAAAVEAAPVAKDTVYMLTEKGAQSLGRQGLNTQQRGVLGLGMAWRNGAVKAPSLRAAALGVLFSGLEDGQDAIVTRNKALALLATINLGTKSPVTRLSAFLRAGLLAEVKADAIAETEAA